MKQEIGNYSISQEQLLPFESANLIFTTAVANIQQAQILMSALRVGKVEWLAEQAWLVVN